jgi:uncharacterized protein YndB with AHSA1/START domain
MPTFALTAHSPAPVEEVWKLLHDPSRFPEWWEGIETVQSESADAYTIWPEGYPDFPMAQRLETDNGQGRVTISCLVSDLVFRWELSAMGEETDIHVAVEIPEREAHRLGDQRRLMDGSIVTLARLAAS